MVEGADMNDLSHLVEQITSGRTAEETFERYVSFMTEYGYERVIYSLLTDHPSLSLTIPQETAWLGDKLPRALAEILRGEKIPEN